MVSAGLFFLAFPAWNLSFTLFFAFVPLLWVTEKRSLWGSFFWAAFSGWLATSIGFHWVGNWANFVLGLPSPWYHLVSMGHGLLLAPLFGLQFMLLNWMRRFQRIPTLFLFPLITAALFSWYPMIFPWSLADAMLPLRFLVQPIDFTGSYGLDFILALSNYWIFLAGKSPRNFIQSKSAQLGLLTIGLWITYGLWQQQTWDAKVESWPTVPIGIVQTNRPASLQLPQPEPGFSRISPLEFKLSKQLYQQGAELVIWPEGSFFGYSYWPEVAAAFHRFVDKQGKALLTHDTYRENILGEVHYYNSALLFTPHKKSPEIYHKMTLVPFGEYTPWIGESKFLKRILGDFLSGLTAGKRNQVFQAGALRLVPKLCYESQFPLEIAQAIGKDAKGKVLIIQSQDGWYGQSNQPEQHLQSSILLAIANRVPLIHAINNGSSGIAGPNGKLYLRTKAFQADSRVGQLPFNPQSGGSFFAENPYLFIGTLRFLFLIYLLVALKDQLLGVSPPDEDEWE